MNEKIGEYLRYVRDGFMKEWSCSRKVAQKYVFLAVGKMRKLIEKYAETLSESKTETQFLVLKR